MRILITAIGSMSAECAIKHLKDAGHFIVGCDIYPKEWHYETKLCDKFYRAPFATHEKEYIHFLLSLCEIDKLEYLIPLTDFEIDVINNSKELFEQKGITLCMQRSEILDVVRNKLKLYKTFYEDKIVPSLRTSLLSEMPFDFPLPCIAKPYNGRSSEGLIRNATEKQIVAIENKDVYIVQEQITGDIFTVDYVRYAKTGNDVAIPRKELLRTKNGAGLTIQTVSDSSLIMLASYIGNKLNINGCINMEFILNNGKYYLIDINPRFSAGIAFTICSGYNVVLNHLRCFNNEDIDKQIDIKEQIIIKKYDEVIF